MTYDEAVRVGQDGGVMISMQGMTLDAKALVEAFVGKTRGAGP